MDILDNFDKLDAIIDRYRIRPGETRLERRKRLRREWYSLSDTAKKNRYHSHRKWKLKNEFNYERTREHLRKHRYKMPFGKYKEMYDSQNGKCKICNSDKKLYVDHNHTTGAVRGLLCQSCNIRLTGIEDKLYYASAVKYLEEYEGRK